MTSLLEFPARTTACVACDSACKVFPPRSSTINWNPPKFPSPCTAGGEKGTITAPVIRPSGPRMRFTIAVGGMRFAGALLERRERCKIIARFGAPPLKLNPAAVNAPSISGILLSTASALAGNVRRVRERRSLRRLNRDDQISGVFFRNESARNVAVKPVSHSERGEKHDHRGNCQPHGDAQRSRVYRRSPVTPRLNSAMIPRGPRRSCPSKIGGERRRQGQCIERGNRD